MAIIWYASLLARIAVSARIWSSRKLNARYGYIALWLSVWSATDIVRHIAATDGRGSWAYAIAWAWTAWPLLALQCAGVCELAYDSARQFRAADRGFLARSAVVLWGVLIVLGIASVCWLECHIMRFDKPLFVQATKAAYRVFSLSSALALLATLASLRFLHPGPVSSNLRWSTHSIGAYLTASAALSYANLAAWNGNNGPLLNALQIGYDWSVLLFGIALLLSLRPSREYDYAWSPRQNGYYRQARSEDARLMREVRDEAKRMRRWWFRDPRQRAA